MKNILILGFILVSTNTLSDGKWLDWGESSMTNLDKITSISGGILFKNRCNNGHSWTLREWINSYKEGAEYYGGFYTSAKPKTAYINDYVSSYKYSFALWFLRNPTSGLTEVDYKTYKKWIKGRWLPSPEEEEIEMVFEFQKHWLESTDESYHSEIVLGDQTIWLSKGLCGDDEITSEKSANELVQDNLDQIRDFLDDDDTYRRLK